MEAGSLGMHKDVYRGSIGMFQNQMEKKTEDEMEGDCIVVDRVFLKWGYMSYSLNSQYPP